MPTILDDIVRVKREEIASLRQHASLDEMRRRLVDAPPPRDFLAALSPPGRVDLIAEIKKASPSKGVIRADFNPVEIAEIYAAAGASCLSVLTDATFFQGSLAYLQDVREAVSLPVLRKDFILDPIQVLEARLAGADAVLLIAECLDDAQLALLHREIVQLGMTPLVEYYEPRNLSRVLAIGARLIGVNNRDLRTFATDIGHTIEQRTRIPRDRLLVGESGIHTRADVLRLQHSGVDAILVGESLMAADDIAAAVAQLLAD